MKANYEIHKMTNERFPFIFHDSVISSHILPPNWHENVEILIFTEGEATVRLDDREYTVHPGDVAVVNTGCIHGISSAYVRRYCLIVDNEFCEENGIDVAALEFTEFFSDPALLQSFHGLAEEIRHFKEAKGDPLALPTVRHRVLGILLYLCRNHLYGKQAKRESDPSYGTVKRVIRDLQGFQGKVTLEEISARAHVSKFHLSHEFKRITGTTVFEYLNALRCENAAKLLRSDMGVSEAATAVGFDNLSYFSRTFKRYMGVLPSLYRKTK